MATAPATLMDVRASRPPFSTSLLGARAGLGVQKGTSSCRMSIAARCSGLKFLPRSKAICSFFMAEVPPKIQACVCSYSQSVSTPHSSPDDHSPLLPSEESCQSPEHESKIDLNFPRRRLQVSFTCDACGERTQRLVNPHAYARGTVFVQCAGCGVYHKLVDNLGLIEEIDYRLEADSTANESEV